MFPYYLMVLYIACLVVCTGSKWTVINCLPDHMAGKKTLDKEWVCNSDGS